MSKYKLCEVIQFKVKLKVIDFTTCDECYFDSNKDCDYMHRCSGKYRTDGKNVCFVEVKDDE